MQASYLDTPVSIIASARTDRESKPYDHAAVSNVPASKHNRHGRRNNQRHAYSMADRQSPLRPSLGSHSRGSRTRSRAHIPSNPRRSRSRVRRPGMRHSNRHIPLLRMQYRGEEPKESASSVWLPFPSRRKPSRGDQPWSYTYGIRIRERFHVLDLAIVAANTAGASHQHNRLQQGRQRSPRRRRSARSVHRHCLVQHSAETLKLETSFSQAPCCTVPETVVDTCAIFDGIIAA